ncbi:hypothetical protein LJR296_007356 [Cupriavidus necator]|uniref:hypothetical protein n=1 Tax=Cupriavidus necator TaxID=106590 RepID=UPI003ED09828
MTKAMAVSAACTGFIFERHAGRIRRMEGSAMYISTCHVAVESRSPALTPALAMGALSSIPRENGLMPASICAAVGQTWRLIAF